MISRTESPTTLSEPEPLHLETSDLEIRNILVATDFSASAHQALQAATAIAGLYGSGLLLAHARFLSNFSAGEGMIPAEFLIDQLAEDKKQMQDLVASQPGLAKLRLDTVVEYGDTVTLVEKLVRKNKIDLVVVGSHGSSGLERLVLGSVAESVAYTIKPPVLIMGPHAHNESDPFKSIVFATDLATTGLRPAQYACSLTERFRSQLLVVHVVEKPLSTFAIQSNLENRLLREMRELLPNDADLACHPQFRIEYGKPGDEIAEAVRSVAASLLIVGVRSKGDLVDHLPWLTLSRMIHEAGCGVLVVRNHFA